MIYDHLIDLSIFILYICNPKTGYDRSTDQTDKSADLSEFADYRYYRSDKPLYRIGIGSADYKGPYRLIGMGIKRAHIGANLVKFEPLKYI